MYSLMEAQRKCTQHGRYSDGENRQEVEERLRSMLHGFAKRRDSWELNERAAWIIEGWTYTHIWWLSCIDLCIDFWSGPQGHRTENASSLLHICHPEKVPLPYDTLLPCLRCVLFALRLPLPWYSLALHHAYQQSLTAVTEFKIKINRLFNSKTSMAYQKQFKAETTQSAI